METSLAKQIAEDQGLPTTRTYIEWVREEVLSWEVEHLTKGYSRRGIRNLSTFLEIVGLDEKYVRAEVKKSEKAGDKFCFVSGWKISWYSIDDIRAELTKCGIAIAPRTGRIKGKALKNKKDFGPGDYELQKVIERFMVKR